MAAVKETQSLESILPDINTKYAYVLAQKNEERGKVYDENGNKRNEVEYKPYMNVLLRGSIVWDGGVDPFSKKPRNAGRHQIRYYDGCTTLFIDDQPKEKEAIDALINSTREVLFTHGFLFVYGYDSMLKLYLDWCSYNENSPYRIPNSTAKFKSVDTEKQSESEAEQLEMEDTARDLAKNAPMKKLRIHAKYLGVLSENLVTGQALSEAALRTEYRKYAKKNPKHFIASYNDKTVEVTTWVTDALNTGKIMTTVIPNSATWQKSNAVITDLSGLKAQDLIIEKLVEYTQIEAGADFLSQLKALYS